MNYLCVGTNKRPLLERIKRHIPEPFLLIDDGTIIDSLDLPKRRKDKSAFPKVTRFDPERHHFNPLKDIDYFRERELVSVLDSISPRGDGTLTKDTGLTLVLRNLRQYKPKYLKHLVPRPDGRATTGHVWAYDKVDEILLSPVLESVFSKARNFPINGILIARLDPAVLGEYDCRVLGNFLISQYPGTVVLTDFPLYAGKHHLRLIRQHRLFAGINTFDEVPQFKQQLLLIDEKKASHCTPDDAETLFKFTGFPKDSTEHRDFMTDALQ